MLEFKNIIELRLFIMTYQLSIDDTQLKSIEHEVNGITDELKKANSFIFSFELMTYSSNNKHFIFIKDENNKILGMKTYPLLEHEKVSLKKINKIF